MEIINAIALLPPMIIALIAVKKEWLSWRSSSKKTAQRKPSNQNPTGSLVAKNNFNQKGFSKKPWFTGLLLLLCIAYVLPEVIIPGELTRMAVYKIVIGVGLFFFLLIQSSISNIIEVIFRFKSAALELIKSFSKEFKKGDNP